MSFTKKEKEKLLSNKYTRSVGDKTIKFTDEFWKEFENRLISGETKKAICLELGYDPDLIGEKRLEYVVTTINSSHRNPNKKRPPIGTKYSELPTEEAIRKMETELTYLRQEVEFLKKISSGKIPNQKGKQ